jgi:hypothetical protein
VNSPVQPYASRRSRRERPRSRWPRRIAILLAFVIVFGVGIALGAAISHGPGSQGTQTIERTVRIVTVTGPSS